MGVLGRLAGAAHRHRVLVVVLWLVAVAAAVGLSQVASGDFKADHTARGSDSRAAQDLLTARFPGATGEQVTVVVKAGGPVTDPAVRRAVDGLLTRIATVPHVLAAPSPYGTAGAISADGRTLQATVQLDAANPAAMPVADTRQIIDLASSSQRDGLQVALGGQVVEAATQGSIGSEGMVPAAMQLLGRANWWLPSWLDRVLPRIRIEGAEDHEEQAEPD